MDRNRVWMVIGCMALTASAATTAHAYSCGTDVDNCWEESDETICVDVDGGAFRWLDYDGDLAFDEDGPCCCSGQPTHAGGGGESIDYLESAPEDHQADCDEMDSDVHPGATEICNLEDDDCDDHIDEGQTKVDWYVDADGDGHGDPATKYQECMGRDPSDVNVGMDCDDGNPDRWPTNSEVCDGLDNDCDTYVPADEADADGDDVMVCEDDCDDGDPNIHPYATEACDGVDNNCDGGIDEGVTTTYYLDADGDGYGLESFAVEVCTQPVGYVLHSGDCDDLDASVRPGVPEVCDPADRTRDDDCDGSPNTEDYEPCDQDHTWCHGEANWDVRYYDNDGDGYGGQYGENVYLCELEPGFAPNEGDCDDGDASIHPTAEEVCDSEDNNCDGSVDESSFEEEPTDCSRVYPDADGDGYGSAEDSICMCRHHFDDGAALDCPRADADTYAVFVNNQCHLTNSEDCNDSDPATHPRYTWNDGEATWERDEYERIDGVDNDCDGLIPAVELDCDQDGYMSAMPAGYAFKSSLIVGLQRPAHHLPAQGVDLGSCEPGAGEVLQPLTCFDREVELSCDEATGLWQLNLATAPDEFVSAARTPVPVGIGDCDDQCAERHPGAHEECDGMDNDCGGTEFADEAGVVGIPDTMEAGVPRFGWVSASEMDLDGDGVISCVDDTSGQQEYLTARSCADEFPDLGDCNDLCGPSAPTTHEVCNGFADACDPDAEGIDLDGDGHRECGAGTDGEVDLEMLYALVHLDARGEGAGRSVIPLVLPRTDGLGERASCDAPLRDELERLLGAEALESALAADSLEEALQYCIRAHRCDEDPALPGCEEVYGACAVISLELEDGLDTDLGSLDAACDWREHPDELITRTVWHRDRILQARELVAWWECYRVFGTYGCADLDPPTGDGDVDLDLEQVIVPGGREWLDEELFHDLLATNADGWIELSRYEPILVDTVMAGCWDEDVDKALAEQQPPSVPLALDTVGGDCSEGSGSANRDQVEGSDDLYGVFFDLERDCANCLDGVDNNCNGLTDCEDPACADCFVGQGMGCGAAGSPCAQTGCAAAGGRSREEGVAAMLLLLICLARIVRRQERRV